MKYKIRLSNAISSQIWGQVGPYGAVWAHVWPYMAPYGPIQAGPVRSGPVRAGPGQAGPGQAGPGRSGRSGPVAHVMKVGPLKNSHHQCSDNKQKQSYGASPFVCGCTICKEVSICATVSKR